MSFNYSIIRRQTPDRRSHMLLKTSFTLNMCSYWGLGSSEGIMTLNSADLDQEHLDIVNKWFKTSLERDTVDLDQSQEFPRLYFTIPKTVEVGSKIWFSNNFLLIFQSTILANHACAIFSMITTLCCVGWENFAVFEGCIMSEKIIKKEKILLLFYHKCSSRYIFIVCIEL